MQIFEIVRRQPPQTLWLGVVVASLLVHLASLGGMGMFDRVDTSHSPGPVKIRVVPAPPAELPPKPKEKPKPKKPATPANAPTVTKAKQEPEPVQGLTKDSLTTTGGMAAPVGNTLMTGDTGKRVTDVDPLSGDQSAPARLIASTLAPPPYTDEALDAGIEGSFIVDVYVNLDGSVRDAELRKKIGYGMDSRVLVAVRSARFLPRKNRLGVPEEGWTELKFTLVIP